MSTGLLRQLAPALADIHGQNEQQLLFNSQRQRDLLDQFAETGPLRDRLAAVYRQWRERGANWTICSATNRRSCGCWICGVFSREEIDRAD